MTWHADTVALDRYARGTLSDVDAASIEAHVTVCPDCRRVAADVADRDALERIKHRLDTRVVGPWQGWATRMLKMVGLQDGDVRLAAGALSMETAWCAASVLAACFAVLAANLASSTTALGVFLVIAPLAPLAGIGISFGRRVDPTFELAQACPMPAMRILLVRAIVVLGLTMPALAVLSIFFMEVLAFAWLLPALALATATLAAGTFVSVSRAAVGLGVLWALGAMVAFSGAPRTTAQVFARSYVMFQWTGQVLCIMLAVVSLLTLVVRRHSFEVSR